ncbi:EbsA family protein [Paludicola sp. MB14-C6]|uniref:EbsA family protein n=1 Tax=Paludihabitans sp. MB14-C6 TaxID=3070656 RepID=UPI0027DE16B2|nr:EbsA family protein [Paludicola sp. MB14-C6]WMJ22957.1 EbsA family protein [Paludicola sp. MB14-C6]
MKLQCRKSTIFNICLWSIIGIVAIVLLSSAVISSELEVSYRIISSVGLFIIIAFCAIMVWNLITMYRHFVVVDENVVTINFGLIRGKRVFAVKDIERVEYTRYNIIFYVKNYKPIKIDLYYIRPEDGNVFVSQLENQGVKVRTVKKATKI